MFVVSSVCDVLVISISTLSHKEHRISAGNWSQHFCHVQKPVRHRTLLLIPAFFLNLWLHQDSTWSANGMLQGWQRSSNKTWLSGDPSLRKVEAVENK